MEDDCQVFSTAILQAAKKVFGPRLTLPDALTVVHRARTDMEQFVAQYPHWWVDTTHILTYQNKKERNREAWDFVQLECKLEISIINAHAANAVNATRKSLYQTMFRTGVQSRVEPITFSGIPPLTELHCLVGMDQF